MKNRHEAPEGAGRHGLLAVAAAWLAALTLAVPGPAAAGSKSAVLELFTSQGCSSCPPADVLIARFAEDRRLLVLSYPVDYWDYLGWKDTLARHEHTVRQQAYAAARGDRSVYTPQVIINGREHAVGSDRRAIVGSVERQTAKYGALPVDVGLTAGVDTIQVSLRGPAGGEAAGVWLVFYDATETVKIGRGENRGATITYTNVVRALVPVGHWTGTDATLQVPLKTVKVNARYDHCAVIVQREKDGHPGEIIGASAALEMVRR